MSPSHTDAEVRALLSEAMQSVDTYYRERGILVLENDRRLWWWTLPTAGKMKFVPVVRHNGMPLWQSLANCLTPLVLAAVYPGIRELTARVLVAASSRMRLLSIPEPSQP